LRGKLTDFEEQEQQKNLKEKIDKEKQNPIVKIGE